MFSSVSCLDTGNSDNPTERDRYVLGWKCLKVMSSQLLELLSVGYINYKSTYLLFCNIVNLHYL